MRLFLLGRKSKHSGSYDLAPNASILTVCNIDVCYPKITLYNRFYK